MPEDRSLQEKRYELLRTELKIWEREYVDRNGTKPTRGEIAANVAIAVKYKEYEKIRALLSGEVPPHTKDRTRKRKEPVAPTTPSKRITKANSTPTHQKLQDGPDNLAVETTPQQPKPLMLGPTPQKNGIFVGIFDQLSTQTPQSERTALTEVNINVPATPSKTSPPDYERSKFTRTPMSEGRRFLLDQFITPRKRKRQHEEQERTPSSIAKRFMTPAFFKQYAEPLEAVAEEEMPMPKDLPGKRPPFLKTLSSMIKELRHAEQDRLDDDLQLLNELEADQTYKSVQADNPSKPSCIVVENRGDLDKDGFIESDVQADLQEVNEAEAAEAQKSGMFRKLWKKKGQKRQTRRVKMRPTRNKLSQAAIEGKPQEDAYSDTDEEDQDQEEEEDPDGKLIKPREQLKDSDTAKPLGKAAGGRKKAPDRANYRKLKIKSKNSKPKGRFGRRR